MVEYSFTQLTALCYTIFEYGKEHGFSDSDFDLLRVRLSDPEPDGRIQFDLGIPRG